MATKTIIGKSNTASSTRQTGGYKTSRTGKVCVFCEAGTEPSYTDTSALRKFVSDRAKIMTGSKTGVCSRHQRLVTREIKHARHLALLPFVTEL